MVATVKEFAQRAWHNLNGATSIEYALIASGVSIVIAGVVFGMGGTLSGLFTSVSGGF